MFTLLPGEDDRTESGLVLRLSRETDGMLFDGGTGGPLASSCRGGMGGGGCLDADARGRMNVTTISTRLYASERAA